MAEQKMVIQINEDGEISVDLDGFKGQGCAAVMDLIENAMGPAARTNKPEYDVRQSVRTQSSSVQKLRS